jgi:hypothetical protein
MQLYQLLGSMFFLERRLEIYKLDGRGCIVAVRD